MLVVNTLAQILPILPIQLQRVFYFSDHHHHFNVRHTITNAKWYRICINSTQSSSWKKISFCTLIASRQTYHILLVLPDYTISHFITHKFKTSTPNPDHQNYGTFFSKEKYIDCKLDISMSIDRQFYYKTNMFQRTWLSLPLVGHQNHLFWALFWAYLHLNLHFMRYCV